MSKVLQLLAGALVLLFSLNAPAHELPGSTATVVLRDGLVTVEANLDIKTWLRAQKARELTQMLASARSQAASLTVQLNGRVVPMTLTRFPTAARVHQILQRTSAKEKGHTHAPKVVKVHWRAARATPAAKAVTVSFPKSIGPVLVSFVEPHSQVVPAGGAAHFKSKQSSPKKRTSPPKKTGETSQ